MPEVEEYNSEEEWLSDVYQLIPESWNFIKTMIWGDEQVGYADLTTILLEFFRQFRPLRDGSWGERSISPSWRNIFRWMACPANKVRGVVLLMEPLPPKRKDYRSIGMALGIKRRSKWANHKGIAKVPTVWNFIEIIHKLKTNRSINSEEASMLINRFKDGFNLEALSSNDCSCPILFLNAFPTKIDDQSGKYVWGTEFVISILESIAEFNEKAANGCLVQQVKIPVLALYSTDATDQFLSEHDAYLDLRIPNIDYARHLAYFDEYDIDEYCQDVFKKLENYEGCQQTLMNYQSVLDAFYSYIFNNI